MAAENHHGGRTSSVNPTKVEHSLDDLARGLADGTISRREAMRLVGAALLGGALASIPGVALAKPPAGTCKELGFKCAANTECCSKNCVKNPQGNGKNCSCPIGQTLCNNNSECLSCNAPMVPNATTCQCECPLNQVVCNGACVSNACGEGQQFNSTTCQCEAGPTTCAGQAEQCLTPGVTPYSLNGECCCRHYAGGGFACFECNVLCFPPCNSDSDCPSGALCTSENPPAGYAGYCIAQCGVDPVSVCL